MEITKMTVQDLDLINLENFDNFWTYNVLKEELLSDTSFYIIAKSKNDIIGFAGIKFLLYEAHVTNIVTRKDKRNLRYWFKTFGGINQKSERNLYPNYT